MEKYWNVWIGLKRVESINHIECGGLMNLESFEIESGSISNVREYEIDIDSVVRWSYVIRDGMSIDVIPFVVSDLLISDNSCNQFNFNSLDFNPFVNLD